MEVERIRVHLQRAVRLLRPFVFRAVPVELDSVVVGITQIERLAHAMGAVNKMLAEIGGKPLVRIAAEQAVASHAQPVIVVTGHEREKVEAALKGLPVRFVHNADYAEGLGTSLKAGIAAVPEENDAAVVCLGDM